MSGRKLVHQLQGEQALAVDPSESVWLSASAGTGKTQVLSARVLRLLLRPGVQPENILCLTFTKAGAAEMSARVNEVLASWVRMQPEKLAEDLIAIGADPDEATRERARMLFARVLDCPGGGLRIDTIHAFAQWLLAAFPEEAGLQPGTRPMEDRDRELLAQRVLADLVVRWEAEGESGPLAALELLSERMGADRARAWLMRCAAAREAWFGPGAWQEPMLERVRQLLGLAADAGAESLAALCADAAFDPEALRQCLAANLAWGTKTGLKSAEAIEAWLAAGSEARAQSWPDLRRALFTDKAAPRSLASLEKHAPDYADHAARVLASLDAVAEHAALIALADLLAPALTVGRRFAFAWDEAKQAEGLVDFDDLIRRAAALLDTQALGEWIRYKLDRRFDHILVDEAQDTNAAQWAIIKALTGDFFAGLGQRDNRLRTVFAVGDYKQAIFRFQGTSPENFRIARDYFAREMAQRAKNAAALRENIPARELLELGLGRSYRTAQPVLDFVDAAIAEIGPERFGLGAPPGKHRGDQRPGLVTLWRPVDATRDDDEEDDGPEGWVSQPEREMATRIARQVRAWLDDGFALAKGGARNAGPGDIMVLVRKRRELAGLIVARLHAEGVPVAGVDRLRLGAPLAVKDLMAALRFAAQPLDDLSLACLLVSPLVGWSQEQLLQHGHRPPKTALWDHLRRSGHADVAMLRMLLDPLLARADFEPPEALLRWLLVGPWQGRAKLSGRLGREANDPIDELLNAALAYAAAHTPSLHGFIRWFDAGEGELKREADGGDDLVRVMTVHGSKGLQAPIVILADATGNPDSSPPRGLSLGDGAREVPLPELNKELKVGPIAEAALRAMEEERQEHWRLLYVAMTRAEEALFIGGALGKRDTKGPAPDSWYARLAPLMEGEELDDPHWRWRKEWGVAAPAAPRREGGSAVARQVALPRWATTPIGPEPRPPRPLAPSAAGQDLGPQPPLPPQAAALAARRGIAIHRLLERLPDMPPDAREQAARGWLRRNAADFPDGEREEMLASALAVLAEPEWAALFSPHALAEVPLAAIVGGRVIAGTADRLLVEPDRVLIADFKTARRPPASLAQVPAATLRQMAAYAAALAEIYPGRRVEAALLYTQVPRLIALPADLLAAHKPHLNDGEQSYGAHTLV